MLVFAKHPNREFSNPATVDEHDRKKGSKVDNHFERHTLNTDRKQALHDDEVSRARNGEELRRSLDDTE